MACAHKCQHREVNCKEKWRISLHKGWRYEQGLASGVLAVRIYDVCVWLWNYIYVGQKSGNQIPAAGISPFFWLCFLGSSVDLVVTPSFKRVFLSWSRWECAGDEARERGHPPTHKNTHTHSCSSAFLPLASFLPSLAEQHNQNSILLDEES